MKQRITVRITTDIVALLNFCIDEDVARRMAGQIRKARRTGEGVVLMDGWRLSPDLFTVVEEAAKDDFVLLPHRGMPTPHFASHCR